MHIILPYLLLGRTKPNVSSVPHQPISGSSLVSNFASSSESHGHVIEKYLEQGQRHLIEDAVKDHDLVDHHIEESVELSEPIEKGPAKENEEVSIELTEAAVIETSTTQSANTVETTESQKDEKNKEDGAVALKDQEAEPSKNDNNEEQRDDFGIKKENVQDSVDADPQKEGENEKLSGSDTKDENLVQEELPTAEEAAVEDAPIKTEDKEVSQNVGNVPPEYPDVKPKPKRPQCELLGKFGSFGWWVQVFLMFTCSMSLIYKRFADKIRRPWLVWWFDVSKQGAGTFLAHGINLFLAKTFDILVNVEADACNWYFINITLDTTMGCLIIMTLLFLLKAFYRRMGRPELAKIGHYGEPPNYLVWRRQLIDFCFLTIVEKLIIAFFVVYMAPTLTGVVGLFLDLFLDYPKVKLTIVMVIWPLICTVGYFWIIDNYLKAPDDRTLLPDDDNGKTIGKRSNARHSLGSYDISPFDEWKKQHMN